MGNIRPVSQENPAEDVLCEATRVLASGGVLVMPTDSVYGIGCAATSGNPAHERIFEIKRRDRAQTLPWLIADAADLDCLTVGVTDKARRLADELWPGALTLVVHASGEVPSEYVAPDGTIAVRVPDSALVRELARRVGPLATTSANTHGREAATSGAAIECRIAEAADLVLDAGPAPLAQASTIVACVGQDFRILRQGAIDEARIREIAGV
jgi:L-threonylcarbamoyladenylate synthase